MYNYDDDALIDDDSPFIHRKGLFWFISNVCENDGDAALVYIANCDKNGVTDKNAPPYNSKKADSYSHENTWPLICGEEYKDKPWNYYPRGRVEIANGKATVYHNPLLADRPYFRRFITVFFRLNELPTRFIPDHSEHYKSICLDFGEDK